MKLHQLPKSTTKKQKRVGRGYGSGKGGHTASRGQKGQKSRSKVPMWFEGGQLPFIRRLPFIKGKNRFKSLTHTIAINVEELNSLRANQKVNIQELLKAGIITKNEAKANIKILGRGTINKALTVELPVSTQAEAKITKAGGKVLSKK